MEELILGSIPTEEQETTINFQRNEEGFMLWTTDRTVMTRLDKLCQEAPENYSCTDVGKDRAGYLLDKKYYVKDKGLLSFRPRKMKREFTEEQLETLRERGRINRAAQIAERNRRE